MQHVIEKPGDGAGGHVQPGVRGTIVNEDLTIVARHPTITARRAHDSRECACFHAAFEYNYVAIRQKVCAIAQANRQGYARMRQWPWTDHRNWKLEIRLSDSSSLDFRLSVLRQ
jgi:hypothetical protein